VRLVVTDVDETFAPLHAPATAEMLAHLSSFLREGGKILFVTGNRLERVVSGVTDLIDPELRKGVLIASLFGVELWGFTLAGDLHREPFVSYHEELLGGGVGVRLPEVADRLVEEFALRVHPPQPVARFQAEVGLDPHDVVLDDRGIQITFEFLNERPAGTLVPAVHERAEALLAADDLPVVTTSGDFEVEMTVHGVSKATAIRDLLSRPEILANVGLTKADLELPERVEIWGDSFNPATGGFDLAMSEALPHAVRSICFRDEEPAVLPSDRNVVLWNGERRLSDGALEYFSAR
jgi:hypothetical protein